jgi:hypothetical protein
LYAEFVDGSDPDSYYFAPEKINFRELYNVSDDYYMLQNIAEVRVVSFAVFSLSFR